MKIHYNSPVVLTFALLCTAIYILNVFTAGAFIDLVSVPPSLNWSNPLSYFRLFSHVLGHDYTSMQHLVGNMTFVLLLGPILEEKYGSKNLLMMILVTAGITGLLNVLFLSTSLMGASGIVFMFIVLVSFTNTKNNGIPLTFVLVLLLFLGQEVLNSFQSDNISQFAHIVGGIFGSIFGYMLRPAAKIS
jgi:membrane associated rhomboid family serine protease